MKRLVVLLMMICAYSATYAQTLTVKSVNLRPQDVRAASQFRKDKSGKKCAIIRVGVVGVDDLVFPAAVGNVERALSEYVVYVPEGLKTLQYENKSGKRLGTIVFDDYGLEINSLNSYDVIFESENHLRSAIFSVQPQNAQLQFNGEKVEIDADGMAMVNAPVGEYPYQVSANGFETQSGTVTLVEDEISTVTNVVLQEILYPVTINVSPEDATVFIDNVPYTKEARKDLQLSGGKHFVRVTAANYENAEQTIDVNASTKPFSFTLTENKEEVVVHKEERTRTKVNIRNAFYLTGGASLSGGVDWSDMLDNVSEGREDQLVYHYNVELSAVQHFAGLFALREGISAGLYGSDDDSWIAFCIPVQAGVSFPFGAYNQNLFSIFGGGYLGLFKPYKEGSSSDSLLNDLSYEYGIRLSAKLDISKFTIGVDISKGIDGDFDTGFSAGLCIGIKLYAL